jgi:hypothetical protein
VVNITADLAVVWSGLVWLSIVSFVINLRVPWNAANLSSGLTTGGLSSSAVLHVVSRCGHS